MERVIFILCIPCIVWKSGYKTNLKCTGICTQHMYKISSNIGPFLKHCCCEDSLMIALKECQNMQEESICICYICIYIYIYISVHVRAVLYIDGKSELT